MTEAPDTCSDWSPRYEGLCRETLATALERVPAYRAWRAHDFGQAAPTRARYQSLPLLGKEDLRSHSPQDFALPECNVQNALAQGTVELVRTNGTSSEAVETLWWQPWWDASEATSWLLNSHTAALHLGRHREALLSSALSVGPRSDDVDLAMSERILGRFLYLNERSTPLLWSDALMERMLDELELFQPVVLEANPSYLARLLLHADRSGAAIFQPHVVILTYELPSAIHLRMMQSAFNCPIVSSYGTTEAGYVFMQCECGQFHQNTASCHVDFLPLPNGGDRSIGHIVVTAFNNPWRYLLRFGTGDLGRLSGGPCPCGRSHGLTLKRVEGRLQNITLSSTGTPLTEAQLDECMARVEGLFDYRLVQHDPTHISCKVMPLPGSSPARTQASTETALRSLYGLEIDIVVDPVQAIAPGVSGKCARVASFARAVHR